MMTFLPSLTAAVTEMVSQSRVLPQTLCRMTVKGTLKIYTTQHTGW